MLHFLSKLKFGAMAKCFHFHTENLHIIANIYSIFFYWTWQKWALCFHNQKILSAFVWRREGRIDTERLKKTPGKYQVKSTFFSALHHVKMFPHQKMNVAFVLSCMSEKLFNLPWQPSSCEKHLAGPTFTKTNLLNGNTAIANNLESFYKKCAL